MSDISAIKTSYYVVAHADDWQLFMFPNGYNDLTALNSNIIIIITTAGDAGLEEAYWKAREEGLKSSLRFCLAPLGTLSQLTGTKEINGHTINYWCINKAACYFLRLPDGNLNGTGFAARGFESLTKFKAGQLNTLTALDGSTTYHNWSDFYNTLQMIILTENTSLSEARINYINPDTGINPDDHADHIATGQAVQAMPVITRLQQALYTGYSAGDAAAELRPKDLFWKAGMFAAYEKAVFDGYGYSTLHEGVDTYMRWCLRSAHCTTISPQTTNQEVLKDTATKVGKFM
jgi:hypothetical protein